MFRGVAIGALAIVCACSTPKADGSRLAGQLPGKHDTGRTIELRADVDCDPARAHALWATEAGVESFLGPQAEIGDVGGPYTVMFFPDDDPQGLRYGTAGAHVLASEPGLFYSFEWVVFASDGLKGASAPPVASEALRRPNRLPTWVELVFTPRGSGSHVEFRHYGFAEGELYAQSQTWFTRAWAGALDQMALACARNR